jgi:hypothetical protein
MLTKVARPALALTASLALVLAVANPAHAGGRGVAAGIAVGTLLGLGIAGAYAAPYYNGPAYYGAPVYYDAPGCYPGPRQCAWTPRHCWYGRWGEYICRGGEWRCWRASICD